MPDDSLPRLYHGYKAGFRTHTEASYRFTHYPTRLRAQGVRSHRTVSDATAKTAKKSAQEDFVATRGRAD